MTPSHKIMISDGAPKALFLTPEARRKAWNGMTLRSVPFAQIATTRDESEETKAFRAQVEEARRQKSLAQIGKMKARFATKTIDYSKVRWDPRRSKFVPDTGTKPVAVPVPTPEPYAKDWVRPAQEDNVRISRQAKHSNWNTRRARDAKVDRAAAADTEGWSRITKDTAEAIARLNGVWKPEYEKLRGTGRIVMTVGNVLRGIVKRGGTVKWT